MRPRRVVHEPVCWRPMKPLLFVVCAALVAQASLAQDSREEFRRAGETARRWSEAWRADLVRPRWSEDGRTLWFRDGGTFVAIDAATGGRRALYDEAVLRGALAGFAPELPEDGAQVEAVRPLGGGALLLLRGISRCVVLDGGVLRDATAEEAAPLVMTLSASRDRRDDSSGQTALLFRNDLASEAEVLWIDGEGNRKQYATIPAGGLHRQHTFAGHEWVVVSGGEDVGFVRGASEPRLVPIAKPAAQAEPERRRGRGRSSREGDRVVTADGAGNIVLKGQDGTEHTITSDADATWRFGDQVWWAPDSSAFVASWRRAGGDRRVHYIESSPRDQLQPKLQWYDYLKPGDEVPYTIPRLFRADGTEIPVDRALFPNPWSIDRVEWLPDSAGFTFVYNERGHRVMRVIRVDAKDGKASAVVNEECPTFFDYAGKFFYRRLDATGEIVWMSERSGWNHLYLIDGATGAVKRAITSGEWIVRRVVDLDEQARTMLLEIGCVAGQDPYHEHFARVSLDGGEPVRLTEADGTHEIEFAPGGAYYTDRWSRVDHPPVLELRRASDGGKVAELDRAEDTALRAAGWRPPERFVAKGRDGVTDIHGVIVRPSTFDAAKKYPVIERIYAGPQGHFTPKGFAPSHGYAELAELGFIVVQMDGMGTSGRSKAFHDVCWKNLGDAGFADRIAWMKAAATKYPEMDLSRVGIFGGSAGGQNAMRALIAHGDFYKAAAADCGCHDNRVDKIWWNELWMSWPIGDHYLEASNVAQAHRMQGRLLLTVGECDRNVDPASTMQVVDALVRADKDFELLVIPGAGHGAGESDYGRRRRADFFVRTLRP